MRQYSLTFDDKTNRFAFVYESKLLKKYKKPFKLIMDKLPDDYKVEENPAGIMIIFLPFTIDKDEVTKNSMYKEEIGEGVMRVGMAIKSEDAEELHGYLEKVVELVQEFENGAMTNETKNLEFLPISGYPAEDLKRDAQAAYENKRDFCVIDTMESYKEFEKTATLNQAIYKYGTDSYNNILLAALSGDIDELKKLTNGVLKKKEWL